MTKITMACIQGESRGPKAGSSKEQAASMKTANAKQEQSARAVHEPTGDAGWDAFVDNVGEAVLSLNLS